MSGRTEIAVIRKSMNAEIRVALDSYKGKTVADVRLWFQPKGGTDYVASRKGLTFDADKLPELAQAIADAARMAISDT